MARAAYGPPGISSQLIRVAILVPVLVDDGP